MNEFNGTPGPWNATVHLFSKRVSVEANNIEIVAVGSADQKVNLYNADLIAAAPSMLAALQEIILLANSRGSEVTKNKFIAAEAESAIELALGKVNIPS